MNENPVDKVAVESSEVNSLKGTLFSTIFFVGGGLIIFMAVLFYFYMTRL